jgi:c-di-GMP-binding flagellar brake protein YcgR
MSKKEYRRSPRRKITENVMVSDTMTDEVVGRVGNISEGGMLLVANASLNEDALYQFRFRLPGADEQDFDVGAHLLWLDRGTALGQSWAGFRFIAMTDEQREFLTHWIESPGAEYD